MTLQDARADIIPSNITLNSAEGRRLIVRGEIEQLPIKVNGEVDTMIRVIIADIRQDLILGADFLNKSKANIDYGSLQLTFQNTTVPL